MARRQRDELLAAGWMKNASAPTNSAPARAAHERLQTRPRNRSSAADIEHHELPPDAAGRSLHDLPSAAAYRSVGFTSTAIVVASGTSSCSSSSRFASSSPRESMPVTLPPGRLRLATRPAPTGSTADREDDRNGRGRGLGRERRVPPVADDHGDLLRAPDRPPAPAADRIVCPPSDIRSRHSGPRRSPASFRPWRNAATRCALGRRTSCEEPDHRHRRLLRARRERPRAAAPPSSVMNSRRLIRSPRRRGQAASAARRGRAPWRS